MPNTEIILTENIPGLGAEADIVKVKAGFARNFLVPRGMAYEVTPATLKKINSLKSKRAEREARELNEAEDLARKINKLKLTMTLETGATGKAFGSITAKDIADKLKTELSGLEVERHKIVLDHPIKTSGAQEVPIKLHHDVTATLHINVKSSAEIAEAAAAQAEQHPAAPAEASADKGGYKAKPKARHAK